MVGQEGRVQEGWAQEARAKNPGFLYPAFFVPKRGSLASRYPPIGAILTQRSNSNQPNIIAFASKAMDGNEKMYPEMHREALAICWAVQHFQISYDFLFLQLL